MDMTAYFLGKVASDASGGGSVQPDYLQNDPTAKDYIKNRPFYSEITNEIDTNIIIPLQEVEGVTFDGMPEGYLAFILDELDSDLVKKLASIVDKGQYNLTIDGTTEQITTVYDSGAGGFLFGNLSIIGIGDDTGETYIGMIDVQYNDHDGYSGTVTLVLQTTETTHTIGLSYIGDVVPIIVEDTYSFKKIEGNTAYYFTNMWEASFEGDNVYNLTFDDESYEGLSWIYHEDSKLDYLGNLSIVGIGDDTGEKCLLGRILQGDGRVALAMITSCEAGDYTVSLEKSLVKTSEIIHKINSKYLDVSHIEKDMDKLQNNLDKLQNFVGTSYSEQLYERYGINRSEYPCITIISSSNSSTTGGFNIKFCFSEKPPRFDASTSEFKFFGDDHYKAFSLRESPTKDSKLKTIVNHLVQVSDTNVMPEYRFNFMASGGYYIYYNYEDEKMNELTNSLIFDLGVSTLQSEVCNIKGTLTKDSLDGIIINSTTEGSKKKFKITVDDNGTISATKITE